MMMPDAWKGPGPNLPGNSAPSPRSLFFHRETEFRQFSQWIHGIRPANSLTWETPLRITLPPAEKEFWRVQLVPKFFAYNAEKLGSCERRADRLLGACRERTLRSTRNSTSRPIVWTGLNARLRQTLDRGRLWNGIASQFRTGTASSTWESGHMPAPWLRKRMRYRSPRNCRKTTPGMAAGSRWKMPAAMKSRGCRSASTERSRNRKPLGGVCSKRSENRTR